ncbi:hypothetical protein ID017_30670 [Pseudomonas aeruginosa]|nr:hypothetical protein [Pseudomonas aeruginosa]
MELNKAPAEQAGGDERDLQAEGAQEIPSPVSQEYDRHLISLLRKGEALPGHQEEAADEIERLRDWNDHLNNTVLPNILNPNFLMLMKGGERLLDLCTKDGKFIGVSLNDMKDVFDWMVTHARIAPDHAALAQPSPAPELERPEVVGYRSNETGMVYEQDYGLKNPEALTTVAECDRIVGALRDELEAERKRVNIYVNNNRIRQDNERLRAELWDALARVAELEGKLTDWVHEGFRLNEALAVAKAQHSVPDDDMILQIFADNAEHSEQGDEHGYCIVREQHAQAIARKLLAAAPGNSAQHSVPEGWKLVPIEPLLNMMSDKDHDTRITAERQLLSILADAPAQAQHSAPEVSGIGRDTGHPRAVVLYLRKEPTDDDLRAIHDALRSLAAAPGKEVPQAWLDVQAERRRQITAEGWTPEHDDLYCAAELPRAAAAYILNGANDEAPAIWPFSAKWWKPRDARANYVRAGALILAEIERLDRARQGGRS